MVLEHDFHRAYIHIIYGHDNKFSGPLISFINNTENGFDISDHLFIVKYKPMYEDLKKYKNVVLDEENCNLYKKYYKHCDLIISHGEEVRCRALFTPKKIKKKIVLRYWGGSQTTLSKYHSKNPLILLKTTIKHWLFKLNYNAYAAIGVANSTDVIDLSALIPNQKFYRLNYGTNENYNILRDIKEQGYRRGEKIRVLLGHRGTPENNHIELLELLKKFNPQSLDIYVPLSYGDSMYISQVKNHITNLKLDNVHLIDSFMAFPEYAKFLSSMDIAIFDGYTSYALGNISVLLFLKKTLYLNKDGVVAKALMAESGVFKTIDAIKDMTLEEFVEPVVYPEDYESDLSVKPIRDRINFWNTLFDDFKGKEKL